MRFNARLYGDGIRNLRKARRLTLLELASYSGITESYLSQIEQGKKTPSTKTREAIADTLDVPDAWISFLTAETNSSSSLQDDRLIRSVKELVLASAQFENDAKAILHGTEGRSTPKWSTSDG